MIVSFPVGAVDQADAPSAVLIPEFSVGPIGRVLPGF
jgi:hypothetical protein